MYLDIKYNLAVMMVPLTQSPDLNVSTLVTSGPSLHAQLCVANNKKMLYENEQVELIPNAITKVNIKYEIKFCQDMLILQCFDIE